MITLKEVAKTYSIPIWTLYKWSALRKFPLIKMGSRVYVMVEDFEGWLAKFKVHHNAKEKQTVE